jgi:hypothetical protein
MEGLSAPLLAAAGGFLVVLLWRVRPALPWSPRRRASREALKEAKARIESAPTPQARALALCDAADIMMQSVGGASSASGLYMRAMRTDPSSTEVVKRVVTGLTPRPRALELLLWRHLAQGPWSSESREATRSVLDALRILHEGPLKNAIRARALGNARDAL